MRQRPQQQQQLQPELQPQPPQQQRRRPPPSRPWRPRARQGAGPTPLPSSRPPAPASTRCSSEARPSALSSRVRVKGGGQARQLWDSCATTLPAPLHCCCSSSVARRRRRLLCPRCICCSGRRSRCCHRWHWPGASPARTLPVAGGALAGRLRLPCHCQKRPFLFPSPPPSSHRSCGRLWARSWRCCVRTTCGRSTPRPTRSR